MTPKMHCPRNSAFSLTELLLVISIVSVLTGLTGPAISTLSGAGSVNKAIADLSGTLELARQYALANHTYCRVLIARLPASAAHPNPSTAIQLVYSADGSGDGDVGSAAQWPAVTRPLVLENILPFDALYTAPSNVSGSKFPSQLGFATATRAIPSLGASGVTFDAAIQFDPSGQVSDAAAQPVRYVVLACDRPAAPSDTGRPQKRNPFALRLFGQNGLVAILRADEL